MKTSYYSVDMLTEPLLSKLIRVCIPLLLSGCLQLAFNAADVIVVGRFAGEEALAAVGSTTAVVNLMTNLFIGLSVGANVVMARDCGAHLMEEARKTVHTAVLLSLISGAGLIVVGMLLARGMLAAMDSPADVIDLSTLYLRIYFLGMPATMVYNFGSALLRAIGDTRRPLYFLTIAGCVNIPLNLFFVIVCRMSVAGVALATVTSQVVSGVLVLRCLTKTAGPCHLELREMHIYRDKLIGILRIGLPAGLQASLFSLSNVLIQSSINSFGSLAMAGGAASASIEGFVYTSMNAVHQAAISFTSQNVGAGKTERISRILRDCLGIVTVLGLVLGAGAVLLSEPLLRIYTSDPAVIAQGVERLAIICTPYFLCGVMEVLVGVLRGMGYSIMPMVVSLSGICLFRIAWIATVFRWVHTLNALYLSYPVSWTVTACVHTICYIMVRRRMRRQNACKGA